MRLIAEKNRSVASCSGPPHPGSPLSVGDPGAGRVVLAAVSDKDGQCPATIMSSPPCFPATPGPLAPGEAGQGDGQGPPQTTTSTTSSPTEPQAPALRLPPTPGGGLGQAGTHEKGMFSLPQAIAAERRPPSPHAGLLMPDPVQLSRGEQASSPQGSVGSGGRLGKGAEKGGHRQKTTDTKRPSNQEERWGRSQLPTQHSVREGPPACPPKKDKWKQAEESPNLAHWPQSGGEERDLQDPSVPPRRPRGNHWQIWRSPARRAPRPPRFLPPAAVRPGAVPGQLDQRGREPPLCFSSNQAPEQPGGGDGCHQRLRPPFTRRVGGGSVEAPGAALPPKASHERASHPCHYQDW